MLRDLGYLGRLHRANIDNVVITPLDNSTEKFLTIAQPPETESAITESATGQCFLLSSVDYPRLKQILIKMEQSLRIMDITKLEFDPGSRTASVSLLTYYLKH